MPFAQEEFELDIFTRMRDKTLDDHRPRLRYLEAHGVRIPYLALEDLIYLKEGSSGAIKDKFDVQALREIIVLEKTVKTSVRKNFIWDGGLGYAGNKT